MDSSGILLRGLVVVSGINRQGVEYSETIIFIHDDIQQTKTEWSIIKKIEVFNISIQTAVISVYSYKFGTTASPKILPSKDFYNFSQSQNSKEPLDMFWDISTSSVNSSILQFKAKPTIAANFIASLFATGNVPGWPVTISSILKFGWVSSGLFGH